MVCGHPDTLLIVGAYAYDVAMHRPGEDPPPVCSRRWGEAAQWCTECGAVRLVRRYGVRPFEVREAGPWLLTDAAARAL